MLKKTAFFFFLSYLLFFIFSCVKTTFAISPVFDNPGQGIFTCHTNDSVGKDYIKGGGIVITWAALQPDNNDQLDSSAINSLISQIKRTGKKVYLHLRIYAGGLPCASVYPSWLKVCDSDDTDNQIGIVRYNDWGPFPQPWDSRYQQKLANFLKLLNNAFVSNNVLDRIEYIEPSAGGLWASTHLWLREDSQLEKWALAAGCSAQDWTCLGNKYTQGVNSVLTAYLQSFPSLPIMIIGGGCKYSSCSYSGLNSLLDHFGMRIMYKAAGVGSPNEAPTPCGLRSSVLSGLCSYNANTASRLTKCGNEPYGDSLTCGGQSFPQSCAVSGGNPYDEIYKRSIREDRSSYYCLYSRDVTCDKVQSTNLYLAQHAGAQIKLVNSTLSHQQRKAGEPLIVNITWKNEGSAPFTAPVKQGEKWLAGSYKLFLEFVKNGTVKHYQELPVSPGTQTWGGGGDLSFQTATATTLSVPSSLASTGSETYQIYIGWTDPNGERKRFVLINSDSQNDLANRRYKIAETFTVSDSGGENCPSGDLGNLNCDTLGKIDETDLNILLSSWQSSNVADLDSDGKVNQTDLNILLHNWHP